MEQFEHLVISSRARLARNLRGIPFYRKMSGYDGERVLSQVKDALKDTDFTLYTMAELEHDKKRALMEKHLISPDLIKNPFGAAMVSRDEGISIMVGEEDHLRIQSFKDGLDTEGALLDAMKMDELLQHNLSYAQDSVLGYLTACPTNVGTGLRVGVMVHLPALTMMGRMRTLQQELSRKGIAVRGMYGEGSGALGQLYQLSNSVTLGVEEEELARMVKETAIKVLEREMKLREALMKSARLELCDRMGRAYGILCYAHKLNYEEFMTLWSDCMLGAEVLGLSPKGLKEILTAAQPYQLTTKEWDEKKPIEERRADVVRRLMAEVKQ